MIGYVGTTGLSTGAHLHYELMVNNRKVDPMRVRLPVGKVLKGKELDAFASEKTRIDELLKEEATPEDRQGRQRQTAAAFRRPCPRISRSAQAMIAGSVESTAAAQATAGKGRLASYEPNRIEGRKARRNMAPQPYRERSRMRSAKCCTAISPAKHEHQPGCAP